MLLAGSMTISAQGGPRLPENIVYSETKPYNPQGDSRTEGQSYNFSASILVYPDTKLTPDAAKSLLAEIDFSAAKDYANANVFVINPCGDKYDAVYDYDAFVTVFNSLRSGNLKLVGIGQGATFVNNAPLRRPQDISQAY